jgi:hypothetical protein
VERLNASRIFDDLKTKRRLKEIELGRAKSKSGNNTTNVVEREIDLLESEIASIGSGAVPLKTEIYLMSFAEAESKFMAEERALSQVKALAGEFSAVIGANFEVISGADLVSLIRSDMFWGPNR